MKKTYVLIGSALVTIVLNSDRAIVLAATTGNPFYNPMTEDIYLDSTAKNPSSDSMAGEMTQLLGHSSSSNLEASSLTIALDPTETASNSTNSIDSTEGTSNSLDSVNSTGGTSNSLDSVNSTGGTSNSLDSVNLLQSNTNNELNLTETSYLTETINSTENVNLAQASGSIKSDLEPVPEPLTIFGTGLALGFGVLFKREYSKKQKNK
jgi:hypothetical protein